MIAGSLASGAADQSPCGSNQPTQYSANWDGSGLLATKGSSCRTCSTILRACSQLSFGGAPDGIGDTALSGALALGAGHAAALASTGFCSSARGVRAQPRTAAKSRQTGTM